jgi:hypothetical protein
MATNLSFILVFLRDLSRAETLPLQASRGVEGETILPTANKLVLLHLFLFHALKLLFLIKNSKTDWKAKEKKIVFFLLAEPCKRRVKIIIFCHFVRLDSLFSWART